MRNMFLVTTVVLVLLFLQGCPLVVVTSIYNHSGMGLVLHCVDRDIEWANGTSIRFDEHLINELPLVKTRNGYTSEYKIKFGNEWAIYQFRTIADLQTYRQADRSFRDDFNYEYRFQIEPDRKMYVIKNNSDFPDLDVLHKGQPPGYPLAPTYE